MSFLSVNTSHKKVTRPTITSHKVNIREKSVSVGKGSKVTKETLNLHVPNSIAQE